MTWLNTEIKDLFFEDTSVGRLKKKIWEASDEEITRILDDYTRRSSDLSKALLLCVHVLLPETTSVFSRFPPHLIAELN